MSVTEKALGKVEMHYLIFHEAIFLAKMSTRLHWLYL